MQWNTGIRETTKENQRVFGASVYNRCGQSGQSNSLGGVPSWTRKPDSPGGRSNMKRHVSSFVSALLFVAALRAPAALLAQSPFDGTWKTNIAAAKLSPKPNVFYLSQGWYHCVSCVPAIDVAANGEDQAVTGQAFDSVSVKEVDPKTERHLPSRREPSPPMARRLPRSPPFIRSIAIRRSLRRSRLNLSGSLPPVFMLRLVSGRWRRSRKATTDSLPPSNQMATS